VSVLSENRLAASRPRVLIAEDDISVLELIVTRLEVAGYETHGARDGYAALARASEILPTGVVLDLSMPRMDGFGVLERMSQSSDLDQIPVLVLSARRASADVQRAIAMGASDYLSKPFETEQLLARVARLVRRQR
jgi:DNA-binding response OmpR family regulator